MPCGTRAIHNTVVLHVKQTMKSKSVIIALILFIALNTSFLWERLPSGSDFLLTMIFGFIGLILAFVFVLKLGGLFIDKFKNQNNNISVIVIGSVLIFYFFFPFGLVRNSDFDPEYYLVANREGAANCQTTIILGIDSTFIERSVCFGVDKNSGTYTIKNDTAFLSFDDNSNKETIGVLEWKEDGEKGNYGIFNYYKTLSDNKPIDLMITKLKE